MTFYVHFLYKNDLGHPQSCQSPFLGPQEPVQGKIEAFEALFEACKIRKKALLRKKKSPHLKKIGTKFRQGQRPLDIPRSSERANPAKKVIFTPEKSHLFCPTWTPGTHFRR